MQIEFDTGNQRAGARPAQDNELRICPLDLIRYMERRAFGYFLIGRLLIRSIPAKDRIADANLGTVESGERQVQFV
jgi:hypothetical protein